GWSPVAFSSDGSILAINGGRGKIQFIDVASGAAIRDWNSVHEVGLCFIEISPDGRLLATACGFGEEGLNVYVWNAANGKQFAQFEGFYEMEALAFSPSGRILAAAGM